MSSDTRVRGVLKSSVEALVQRTRHDRNRPLLQTEDPKAVLRQVIEERGPLYEEVADLVIETEQVSVHRVVKQIVDRLQQQQVI